MTHEVKRYARKRPAMTLEEMAEAREAREILKGEMRSGNDGAPILTYNKRGIDPLLERLKKHHVVEEKR
jgi:hypothetical protein